MSRSFMFGLSVNVLDLNFKVNNIHVLNGKIVD